MSHEKEIRTVGQLRALTAVPRAVDRVEVYVYLPNTRGPVKCYIAGHTLKRPDADSNNTLTLQIRAERVEEPEPEPEPALDPTFAEAMATVVADATREMVAGKVTDRVPNEGGET